MTGLAVAAAAAGAVAYVMNHTTPAERRRAIRRTANRMGTALDRMGTALDRMADSVCRTMLG